jgi:hypothetical protein
MQGTVDARLRNRRGKSSKVPYLNVADLQRAKNLFGCRREIERRLREIPLAVQSTARVAAGRPPLEITDEDKQEENAILDA